MFAVTRFGLATRAAAENEKGAVVLGFSPDFLAGANWVLSTLITGMLGILVASVQKTVDPITIPALIVPALTAALVGSFTSFGWTTFTAFVLGHAVPLIHVPRRDAARGSRTRATPRSRACPTLLPVVVIIVVLFLAARACRRAVRSRRADCPSPSTPVEVLRS